MSGWAARWSSAPGRIFPAKFKHFAVGGGHHAYQVWMCGVGRARRGRGHCWSRPRALRRRHTYKPHKSPVQGSIAVRIGR
eukprot:278316-Chlamydomonas_euryale.AAC.1